MPKLWEFRLAERRQWNTHVRAWTKRKGYQSSGDPRDSDLCLWNIYQEELLSPLEDMAQKHGVSVASVLLRWSLQLDHVASTAVTCRLVYPDDGAKRRPRAQALREVFTFCLDDVDMAELWELSGRIEANHLHVDFNEEMMMESENGLLLPSGCGLDLRNSKLWL